MPIPWNKLNILVHKNFLKQTVPILIAYFKTSFAIQLRKRFFTRLEPMFVIVFVTNDEVVMLEKFAVLKCSNRS